MRKMQHLAIIMDGNGRWAEQRGMPRIAGHQQGVETVRQIVKDCIQRGIRYLTLYAFSSENWRRPQDEVTALMTLLGQFLKSELPSMQEQGIRLNVIGEISRLPAGVQQTLEDVIAQTAGNSALVLTLALSYGGRDELVRAVRALAVEVEQGRVNAAEIDEHCLGRFLDTLSLPDPDLLIRTSGEMRISNFLLWQIAYTELYFTEALWPEFDASELDRALQEFGRRQRRFGLTGDQVRQQFPSSEEKRH